MTHAIASLAWPQITISDRRVCVSHPSGWAFVHTKDWGWGLHGGWYSQPIEPVVSVTGGRLVLRPDLESKIRLHLLLSQNGDAIRPFPLVDDFTLAVLDIYPDDRILLKTASPEEA